jgi:hypothetical protein
MGKIRTTYKIFVRKPVGKRPFQKLSHTQMKIWQNSHLEFLFGAVDIKNKLSKILEVV